MQEYNLARPWVLKVRSDGSLAADIYWHIDDGRPTAASTWESWKTSRKACSTLTIMDYRALAENEQKPAKLQESGQERWRILWMVR